MRFTEFVDRFSDLDKLFFTDYIDAQRPLEDGNGNRKSHLSSIFERYFIRKVKDEDDLKNRIRSALEETTNVWNKQYENVFEDLIGGIKTFGYPGLTGRDLLVNADFDAGKLMSGNTKVGYKNADEIALPEGYNGLGFSNLIMILMRLMSAIADYEESNAQMLLIFVEEPEAHLHPQMQYTFIQSIYDFVFEKASSSQVLLTTHSSHIISRSEFHNIRYFDSSSGAVNVKDLRHFSNVLTDADSLRFLKQYLKLSYCELFFADKVVLIEGTVERLLLPFMISKLSSTNQLPLSSQYISVIEIGGAYAYKFKELLEFLEVKTLIITDIDAIDPSAKRSAVEVIEFKKYETSNKTLVDWLPKLRLIDELVTATESQKISGNIRVAYQIHEDSTGIGCGRSFEEAFLLRNSERIAVDFSKFTSLQSAVKLCGTEGEVESNSYPIAGKISKKTDFAFDVIGLDEGDWETPKYIEEGLLWLEE